MTPAQSALVAARLRLALAHLSAGRPDAAANLIRQLAMALPEPGVGK
jgi:hypothetical protein